MVLKLESKRCADLAASSTYTHCLKLKLWLPNTPRIFGEPFPSLLEEILQVRPLFERFAFRVHDFYYSIVRNND